MSIIHSEHLITKIYFPRMVATFASIGVYVVDFTIAFLILLGLIGFFAYRGEEVSISPTVVFVPIVLGLFAFAALSVGIFMAALNVTYRDFRLVIPFAMQMWFFTTPVIFLEPPAEVETVAAAPAAPFDGTPQLLVDSFSQEVVKSTIRYHQLSYANPLVSLITTFRATVIGGPIPWGPLGTSLSILAAIFLIGSLYFHRVEDRFADII
jgi:lipopolysaccharide transport system permease protein